MTPLFAPSPSPPAAPRRAASAVPFLLPAARAVLALEPRGCRWPEGALDDDAFRFCGLPARPGSTYCDVHRQASRAGGAR